MEEVDCLSCKISLGKEFFEKDILENREWFVVTETNVHSVYKNLIESWGFPVCVFNEGERFKTRKTKTFIEDFLLKSGCKKNSGLIGFGGGVVSDMVGFVASTYMRGIPFVLVPTSLLAMVDSTIGGKNAVDTEHGKNLIGTIYRPKHVYIDLAFLHTLPADMWAAGMSEVIKIAAILDKSFFTEIAERSLEEIMTDKIWLQYMIKKSIELKASIVEQDEHESQLRMILNFGHTIGHALEAEVKDLNHGLCVSIGMYCELEIGNFMNKTNVDLEYFKTVLESYKLPTKIPEINFSKIISRAKLDKKRRTTKIPLYIPSEIGKISPSPLLITDEIFSLFLSSSVTLYGIPSFDYLSIPGSKSLTNRYILLSALCKTPTRINRALFSEDTSLMIKSLEILGLCKVNIDDKDLIIEPKNKVNAKSRELYVGNAGTVARFLAMTCLIIPGETLISGYARMHLRPIKDLVEAMNITGQRAVCVDKEGHLPLLVKGGGFAGGRIEIDPRISSQYVSSVLMASPCAEENTEIILKCEGEPTSYSYILMTIKAMQDFGATVTVLSPYHYQIPNTGYKSPGSISVEPDAGSASYFFALAALHKKSIAIQSLGSKSTQGELKFIEVLEQMGCIVKIDDFSITIQGNDLSPVKVNMNNCTDSFITAAILMANCDGESEITGIENQRFKECDRISAVIHELSKFGVFAESIPSGIRIIGKKKLKEGVEIETYDDHRIAMAFAVLGTMVPGVVIKGRRAVDKTFPTFWKAINECGIEIKSPQPKKKRIESIIIVGMRGVGKSTLGMKLSEEIGWNFIDLDCLIQEDLHVSSLSEWIIANGIENFRNLEHIYLQKCLLLNKTIIATGGGIVEHVQVQTLLMSHYPVIWINTSLENISHNLEHDASHRMPLNLNEAYIKRVPLFEKVYDYQFNYSTLDIETNSENFRLFCYKVLGKKCPLPNDFSNFGCASSSKNLEIIEKSQYLTAAEIRSDLYENIENSYKDLHIVKEKLKGGLSIFTWRGNVDEKYWEILKNAGKYLPDFIDVQFEFGSKWLENFEALRLAFPSIRIILSYHTEILNIDFESIFNFMCSLSPDVVKFISPRFTLPFTALPHIHFSLGSENLVTRIQNTYFSPVRLGECTGKGQLTYEELIKFQLSLNVMPEKKCFYLAGNNISRSPAKSLYNRLFSSYGLDYTYEFLETNSLDEIIQTLKSPHCLGMSITIPYKELIIPYLDSISPEAQALGAVNTIVKRNGRLIGTNTDWHGLYYPLKFRKVHKTHSSAAVLGAGGTSKAAIYALLKLKLKITLWNRSKERLTSGAWPCTTTQDLGDIKHATVIVSTIPGNAEILLPWLNPTHVVLESAYFPDETFIGKQANQSGAILITGKEMYLYMARYQFRIFTGKDISKEMIRNQFPIFKN